MKLLKTFVTTATAIAGLVMAGQAQAAVYLFNLTGAQTASFSIDTDVNKPVTRLNRIDFTDVAGTFDGTTGIASVIRFFGADSDGGFNLEVGDDVFFGDVGPQLFSGTLAAPIFEAGEFRMTNGTMTISAAVAAIPEPASWALMLVGFGGISAALRRRPAKGVVRDIASA